MWERHRGQICEDRMIALLQLLFLGHIHKWSTIRVTGFERRDSNNEIVALGRRYVIRCDRCGWLKKRDLA